MNGIERLFTAVLIIALVAGFFYLIFALGSLSEEDAAGILGAAVADYEPESVRFAVNNELFSLQELESMDYYINKKNHRITLINVNTAGRSFCQIIIDGDISDKLYAGESQQINGLKITIGEFYK